MSVDIVRQIDKALDVLRKVEKSMFAEAEMNAVKHLADVVRPVPLAGLVSSLIADYEGWRTREDGGHFHALRDPRDPQT